MKSRIKTIWLHLFALLFVVSIAHAQPAQQAQSNFSQPELDQMLAPIALYPDALLSQVLMASTYPTEVVEASYWLKDNPNLRGEDAVKAAENQQWDISVKSLLPFQQVLGTMESKLDWTQNLGNAFLGQQQQVMDTIQSLRRKAMQAGYLKSDNRVRVDVEDQLVSINLVQPSAVYVPYYNPTVVYGTWWEPAYQPVYWDPWPGYTVHSGYGWAWAPVATAVTVGVLYGAFNWRHHHIYNHRYVNYWHRHYHYDHYRYRGSNSYWRHDPRHRRDIPYRHATVNRNFGHAARTYNSRVGHRPTVRDIRTSHHNTVRTTGRTMGSSTGKTTGRTTGRTTLSTTRKTTGKTTGSSTGKTIGRTTGRTTLSTTRKTTGRTTGSSTGKTIGRTTGRTTLSTTRKTTGKTTGSSTGRTITRSNTNRTITRGNTNKTTTRSNTNRTTTPKRTTTTTHKRTSAYR